MLGRLRTLVGRSRTLVGRCVSTVGGMTSSWDLSLTIDAHGHDDTQVSVVPGRGPGSPHLKVRAGLVVVHCLDGAAAMSAARAWAAARLAAMTWLPPLHETRQDPAPHGYGAAYPVGSIIFDGRQPWHVEQVGPAMSVTVGPLQVCAHDLTALDTHMRAWTEASAVATRLFPGKAVPFARLIEHERLAALRAIDSEAERRRPRRNPRPASSPPQHSRDPRRDEGPGQTRGRD